MNDKSWVAKVLAYNTHSVLGAVRDVNVENMPNMLALEEDDNIVRRPFGMIPVLLEPIFNGILNGLEEDAGVAAAEDLCCLLEMTAPEVAWRCGDSEVRLTTESGDGGSAN